MTADAALVILVTGAATGIGNLTATALARAGHTVIAGMRDPAGRNAERAAQLLGGSDRHPGKVHVVELDVTSQRSADEAVRTIVEHHGRLDAVVHNAGHLYLGYTEAFTADQISDLFDVNVLGAHRVNRAVLPVMRAQGRGTLVYVGSTTTVSVPPFLGPYVASKFALDGYAQALRYELNPLGIDTTIVMPGAFTTGTAHFANASQASDRDVTAAYAQLDPLVARTEQATAALIEPGAHPSAVADEIVRLLAVPHGQRPLRSVVDFTGSDVATVIAAAEAESRDFVTRLGYRELLGILPAAQAADDEEGLR